MQMKNLAYCLDSRKLHLCDKYDLNLWKFRDSLEILKIKGYLPILVHILYS